MAKSRAEIQAAYRKRKKEKAGDAYKQRETERVMRYYTPTGKLTKKKRLKRQARNREYQKRHRLKKKAAKNVTCMPVSTSLSTGCQSSTTPTSPKLVVELPGIRAARTRKYTGKRKKRTIRQERQEQVHNSAVTNASYSIPRSKRKYLRISNPIAPPSSHSPTNNRCEDGQTDRVTLGDVLSDTEHSIIDGDHGVSVQGFPGVIGVGLQVEEQTLLRPEVIGYAIPVTTTADIRCDSGKGDMQQNSTDIRNGNAEKDKLISDPIPPLSRPSPTRDRSEDGQINRVTSGDVLSDTEHSIIDDDHGVSIQDSPGGVQVEEEALLCIEVIRSHAAAVTTNTDIQCDSQWDTGQGIDAATLDDTVIVYSIPVTTTSDIHGDSGSSALRGEDDTQQNNTDIHNDNLEDKH